MACNCMLASVTFFASSNIQFSFLTKLFMLGSVTILYSGNIQYSFLTNFQFWILFISHFWRESVHTGRQVIFLALNWFTNKYFVLVHVGKKLGLYFSQLKTLKENIFPPKFKMADASFHNYLLFVVCELSLTIIGCWWHTSFIAGHCITTHFLWLIYVCFCVLVISNV